MEKENAGNRRERGDKRKKIQEKALKTDGKGAQMTNNKAKVAAEPPF